MYHINPAVIKTILASMPQKELVIHMRYIRFQVSISDPGSNRRQMLVSLYQWCILRQEREKQEILKRHSI